MRAHVPAVSQKRHRVRHQANRDLEDHHCGSDTDDDASAPFRMRKIRNEIVRLVETRMIGPMHQAKLPRQRNVILKNRTRLFRKQCWQLFVDGISTSMPSRESAMFVWRGFS